MSCLNSTGVSLANTCRGLCTYYTNSGLIKKGRCSLSRKASDQTKEIIYQELSAGDTFGEQEILLDEPRNMTVTAVSDMQASRIDAERFIKFIKFPALKYIDYKDLELEREQDPDLLVLDIHSVEEYKKSHIEGSHNVPFFRLRLSINELKQAQARIVVCADSRLSEAAAFELIKQGVNALVLNDGMQSTVKQAVAAIAEDEAEHATQDSEEPESAALSSVEISLQEKNQILAAENERLNSELTLFKKQCRLLYKQAEKLKAALDKLRWASKP
ncbi:hypothetical protein BJAS_P2789 [Bathymodiolus japonicus methanotrophic gill symbiont]|nr:hypothetical protein BJAS_P2789 [Bathymodiolus japonicus methanotrophic gill symbiont]